MNDSEKQEVSNISSAQTHQGNDSSSAAENFTFDNKTIMASLAYLGPLVLIPFLVNKSDTFIKFHTKQGFIIFGILIASYLLGQLSFLLSHFIAPILAIIGSVLNIFMVVLVIIGIRNALQNKEEELPIVGKFAKNIKI